MPHELLRCRKVLGSSVRVFADVAVKHSAPLAPRALEDEVEDTVLRGRADAVIISGAATGKKTGVDDIRAAKRAGRRRSGFRRQRAGAATVSALLSAADGLIVGTSPKQGGVVTNPVDRARVAEFMGAVRAVRKEVS